MNSTSQIDAKSRSRGVYWFKRDFRLQDNPALTQAMAQSDELLFVFLYEPLVLQAPETSAFHVRAWTAALEEIDRKLRELGHTMLVLHGDAQETFQRIYDQWHFQTLYSHEEIGSELTFGRDRALATWCKKNQVAWHESRQTGVFRPLVSRDDRGILWKEFMLSEILAAPGKEQWQNSRPTDAPQMKTLSFAARRAFSRKTNPEGCGTRMQRVTESTSWETLESFLNERALGYSGGISSPNSAFQHGSRLSIHLAWGTISSRVVHTALQDKMAELKGVDDVRAKQMRKSLNAFRSRIHWRDHFMQRLESEPSMEFHALNPAFEDFSFDGNHNFEAWFAGQTGFPLVDACMRCAHATGFLNFRMRALVTSTACHLLHIHWKKLLYPMARIWADYEPGIHVSQLQMQAGMVGINTLRIYNPGKQIIDQDPACRFIKHWVPELRTWSAEDIVRHQEEPRLDRGYVAPLVNRTKASKVMRDAYYALKRLPETKKVTAEVLKKHGSRKKQSSKKARKK